MKKGLFEKRIPTGLALFILLVGLVITSILVKQGTFTSSHATPNEEPQGIQIANVTDTSFTVAFETLDPTIAGINIANTATPTTYYDVRNTTGGKAYVSHLITATNLSPKTTYTFTIISNGQTYLDHGKTFTVTTNNIHVPVSSSSLSGTVLLPDGTPGSDVLITVAISGAQNIAAVTNDSGAYSIPMSIVTSPDGQPLTLIPNTEIKLTATKALLTSHFSYHFEPQGIIPTISLSNNYAFTASEEEQQIATPESQLAVPSGGRKTEVGISIPKFNQSFIDTRPEFRGTAGASTLLKLSIRPDNISVSVRANPNGNWAYRSNVALSAGNHTLTVNGQNAAGVASVVSIPFTVFASGSQIAESATPSATLTPTTIPTVVPSPAPTLGRPTPTLGGPTPTLLPTQTIPSPTPITATGTIAPTPTITIAPTDTPIPTVIAVIPPKTVPPTGDTTQTIFLTTMSLLFIVSGSVLLFIL